MNSSPNTRPRGPSSMSPRTGTRLSQRGMVSVLMLFASIVALSFALFGSAKLVFDIFNIGLIDLFAGLPIKVLVVGLAYTVGWIAAMVAIRVYGNLVLPVVINFFIWGYLIGVCALYILILQRLYTQTYDLVHYWTYVMIMAAGLAGFVGLYFIIEDHDLRPFSIPLLIIAIIQLGLIVFRYVFAAGNPDYLWADLLFFFLMTAFTYLMLANIRLFQPLQTQLTNYFDRNSKVIRVEAGDNILVFESGQSGTYNDTTFHQREQKVESQYNAGRDIIAPESKIKEIHTDPQKSDNEKATEHEIEKVLAKIGKKHFKISIAHPKLLTKRFESPFLVQAYFEELTSDVKAKIREIIGENVSEHDYDTELKFGQLIKIRLYSPSITFPEPITKKLSSPLNSMTFLGKPLDECQPGEHKVVLSILDNKTGIEYQSETFAVKVVDFAFDHVSRPLLSRFSTVILGTGSVAMFVLTLLEQIDKTVGLTSGTAAGILAVAVYANFYNLYQRVHPNAP